MPIKVDIVTNFKDHDLTLESCIEMIKVLQESYKTVRQEMYQHFLGTKHLKHALIVALCAFLGYLLTDKIFFIYAMPIIVIIFMISSIVIAEYLTSKTREVIQSQINHFTKQKELLLKKLQEEKAMTQH